MDVGVLLIIIGTVVVLYGAGMLRTAGGGSDPVSVVREAMATNREQGIPTRSLYVRDGDREARMEADTQAARNPLEDILSQFGAGTGPGNGHPG